VTRARVIASVMLSVGLAAMLGAAVLTRTFPPFDLAVDLAEGIPQSGVEHPITAVLLQFRSYDTLLEIAVLLVAVVVALALRDPRPASEATTASAMMNRVISTPVLASLTLMLLPLMLMTAVYLLWAGAFQPGGAFQAGAVLAALGVLWRVAGRRIGPFAANRWQQLALLAGFASFLAAATATLLFGRPLLAWPSAYAGVIIVAIETVLTVSIGISLLGLFASAPDPGDERP